MPNSDVSSAGRCTAARLHVQLSAMFSAPASLNIFACVRQRTTQQICPLNGNAV